MIGKSVFHHPCGGCAGCRLKRSREWAVRCSHEASLWPENSFITLTYDDDNLPHDRSLDKKYFQDFMKRFRKELEPRKVRYMACGEYGDSFGRPHYHFICFNYDPRNYARYDESGRPLEKDLLQNAWSQGFVNVRDFNFERAQYVAKYIMKKLGGKEGEKVYLDAGILPEFALMSRMPGIGYEYYKKFGGGYKDVDTIHCAGKEVSVPRFYRKKFEEHLKLDVFKRREVLSRSEESSIKASLRSRRDRVSEYRAGVVEEIVERSGLQGKPRSPRQYFKEVVGQRVRDFECKQELKNIGGK